MKDNQPLVSIGMPVYNAEQFLKQALDSLLAQDYENFEIVISDNASVDATKEICEGYLGRDARIRYNRNPSNMGPHLNFLKALELSRGKYFMWAAHDDLWESSFISKLIAAFQKYDDVALACCDYDTIYHLTGRIESHGPLKAELSAQNSIFQNAIWMITFPHSPFYYGIYDTNLLKSSRYFTRSEPLDFGDLLLLNEISVTGKIQFVPETLFHAGVKDEVRPPVTFAKRRLPGFKFSYRKYYTETIRCITRAARLTSIQKFYLVGLITNQALTHILHKEPIPNILKTAIQKELLCSSRVADRLLALFYWYRQNSS
jgi:glycosyltransferase involved in cell wall biosynthesis